MKGFRRALALAAAFHVSLFAAAASAQTVIVTKAPPAGKVELALNGAVVSSSPAGPTGEARLTLDLQARAGRPDMDARIFLDLCADSRRVQIVERGLEPPVVVSGCRRKELMALFLLRPVTTLVVDASEASPDVWLRQGRVPSSWLKADAGPEPERSGGRVWQQSPKGLMPFGGAGIESYSRLKTKLCGNFTDCATSGPQFTYTVGAVFWLTPFLGVESSYVKPQDYTASGGGSVSRFSSTVNVDIITIAANVGVSAGPFRIYGKAGTNYHRADFSIVQTIDDKTVTVGEESQVIPGGTQTVGWRTDGWAWLYGGGTEIWVSSRFAIFGEFGWISLKGVDMDGGEGGMDEQLTSVLVGLRVRLRR